MFATDRTVLSAQEVDAVGMNIAIVGANGFVGSRMVERWHINGEHRVVPVVRGFTSLSRLSRLDLDCKIADALNESSLRSAFEGCEIVVHCVQGSAEVIKHGAAVAYRAANAAGAKRFIFLSSAAVHGQDAPVGTDETTPLSDKQWHWYNNAKVFAERTLLAARKKGVTEAVILRPAVIWGPRSGWVANFAASVMAGNAYVLNGGTGVLNSVFIDNLIHAVELALGGQNADREAFLVRDDEAVTWRDLFEPICTALGHPWSDVWDLPSTNVTIPSAGDRVQALKSAKVLKAILPRIPPTIKRTGVAVIQAWPTPTFASPFAIAPAETPAVSEDILCLQTGTWRFPDEKLRKALGYRAEVSFANGIAKTIDWLRFAGYTVSANG